MQTELLPAVPLDEPLCQASVTRAADLLKTGRLVAFPTDTVYGLGALSSNADSVARLYLAKRRPASKPIPVLLASVEDLHSLVTQINAQAQALIARFWPGALTLILPKSDIVPREVSPTPGIAVRLPNLPLTRWIIAAVGTPLAVTSANRSGKSSTSVASEVLEQLDGRISAVVDGGRCPGGTPSTILDCTVDPPRVLRVGAIPIAALRQVIPLSEL